MIVKEIMELTGQKRGTIDLFRSELSSCGLLSNNESLDDRAVKVFRRAVNYKEDDGTTWSKAMQKAIQEEYGEEMKLPFNWDSDIILVNLIWEIENEYVKVSSDNTDYNNPDFHVIYEIIIENFRMLGKSFDVYADSYGTDGNPIITYKCQGSDYIYYIVGKYNAITKTEDAHIFYNDSEKFNIMRCKHICGGNSDKGRIKELLQACRKKTI